MGTDRDLDLTYEQTNSCADSEGQRPGNQPGEPYPDAKDAHEEKNPAVKKNQVEIRSAEVDENRNMGERTPRGTRQPELRDKTHAPNHGRPR